MQCRAIVEGNMSDYVRMLEEWMSRKKRKGADLCDILQQLHKRQNLRSKCILYEILWNMKGKGEPWKSTGCSHRSSIIFLNSFMTAWALNHIVRMMYTWCTHGTLYGTWSGTLYGTRDGTLCWSVSFKVCQNAAWAILPCIRLLGLRHMCLFPDHDLPSSAMMLLSEWNKQSFNLRFIVVVRCSIWCSKHWM